MENKSRENYKRVTEILSPFTDLHKIDPEIVKNAGERGSKVHKICESIMKGIGEFGVEEEIWGYIESFKKWFNEKHDVIMIEERFWDDELMITGQVDIIINTPEGMTIVDLKTSYKPSKTWSIQGSAYAYLARKNNHDIQKIYFLHLDKHGKYPKIYQYDIDADFFLNVYKVYKHFYG